MSWLLPSKPLKMVYDRFAFVRMLFDPTAGTSIIAGLALPLMLGAAGLAFDINRGLNQRVMNQRAADMGALAAAMAYKATTTSTILQPTAIDMVRANGIASANVTADLVNNFPASGDKSVRVQVRTPVPFTLARVLGLGATYTVTSQSYASLISQPPFAAPCFLALSSGSSALSTAGGATINAPNCTLAAVGEVNNGGTGMTGHDIVSGTSNVTNNYGTITAQTLRYAGSFNNPAWNSNVPPADKRVNQPTTLTDPWSNSTDLSDARALIGTNTAVPSLSNPSTPTGTDWNFDYSHTGAVAGYWQGNGRYVVPAGNYAIRRLTVAGGVTVVFQNGSNITISNGFVHGGASFNFGNANISVNGGFDTGSNGVIIGDGSLWIGSGTVRFQGTSRKGNGDVMINSVLTLGGGSFLFLGNGAHSFGGFVLGGGGSVSMGSGNFISEAGIDISGGSELQIGNGNVILGPNSANNAVNLAGSARFFMGDGSFSAKGNIVTAGGSRIAFGQTPNHLINGNMTIAGAALFGRGRYTINGNFTNGTGGTTWPFTSSLNGQTYGDTVDGVSVSGYDMAGVRVSFVLAGTLNLAGGAKTKLIAATTTANGGEIADILVTSRTSSATNWSAGSSNVFVGTVYLPNSVVTMSGGSTTLSGGQCFTLIASKIAATGGAAAGSACQTMVDAYGDAGSTSTIKLVR